MRFIVNISYNTRSECRTKVGVRDCGILCHPSTRVITSSSLPSLPPVPSTSLPEFSASDQSLLPSTLSSCTRYQCTRNPNHLQFSQFLIFHLCFPPSVGLVHTSASDMGRVNYSPNFKVLTITLMESGMSARATQQYLLSRVTRKTLAVWRKLYRETLAVIWDPASHERIGRLMTFTDQQRDFMLVDQPRPYALPG
ncbi:hypothetical protein CROQUDRAFT_111123 [Cronartium quercuum f. sp. fusiforme G11]|uniref:Uncharacterized protein n=1 Tax=Cronartium quercuum f. sp. fusiforme G11 TaxID=708437 RepID=A0A9P6N9Z1_9BASI|nr:hypothetical protein CROQUDRAFT_111123 [Cronartium quercuum f. sp. fusiforme G11]